MKRTLQGTLTAALLAAALPGCSRPAQNAAAPVGREKEAELPSLSPDEVEAMSAKGELDVFDANGEGRFKRGHVPGAKWVGHDLDVRVLPADKDRKLVFYCSNQH
jgi:hypothetical protein